MAVTGGWTRRWWVGRRLRGGSGIFVVSRSRSWSCRTRFSAAAANHRAASAHPTVHDLQVHGMPVIVSGPGRECEWIPLLAPGPE
jgi:hypothetical protein